MKFTIDRALQKGIEAQKAGKAQEADRYYTAILKANPKHPDANHNMGILAVDLGKVEEALPFLKTALEVNSSIDQYWLSYIFALIKLDRIADAKAVFNEAKSKGAKGDGFDQIELHLNASSVGFKNNEREDGIAQSNILDELKLDKALKFAKQKVKDGLSKEAKKIYRDVLKRFPKNKKALDGIKALASRTSGNTSEMQEAPKELLNWVVELYNQQKFQQAFNKAQTLTKRYNKSLALWNLIGASAAKIEKPDEAVLAFQKALSIKPDYAEAHYNLGNALKAQEKLEEAIEAYTKALLIKPDYAEAYNNIGGILKNQSKLEEAIEAYTKALLIKPDYAEAHYNLGNALKAQEKLEEAIESYNMAISIKPDHAEAHHNLSKIKKYTEEDKQFLQVQELYKSENLSEDKRCSLSFALAKMYEDIGKLDYAFSHLIEGNALRKKLLKYSITQDLEFFNRLKETQPHLLKNSMQIKESSIEPKPIFILGMPRSGTSLVEQIISSHSEVVGAGELNYVAHFGKKLPFDPSSIKIAAISEFRRRYLSELTKLSYGKSCVTDKLPHNFLYIPLIRAAFPESKIVHVRRNAAATCWSNYKHYFTTKNLGYCYDLKDVVSYYALYSDLMQFWQLEYSDGIYNLNYEKLTTNQESETRKLVDHLGLDWEEACLSPQKNKRIVRTASQQQVRQKVYQSSSEVWRKYEPYLNGAFSSLPSS